MHVPIPDCPHCKRIKTKQTSLIVRTALLVQFSFLVGIMVVRCLFDRYILGKR